MSSAALTAVKTQPVRRRVWEISESKVTPEAIFHQRRRLLKAAGLFGLGLLGGFSVGCGPAEDAARVGAQESPPGADLYPARRNSRFTLDRPVTEEAYAASYNNFYEFSSFKSRFTKMPRDSKPIPGKLK